MSRRRRFPSVGRAMLRWALAGAVIFGGWVATAALLGPSGGVPTPLEVASWWFGHSDTVLAQTRQTASVSAKGFLIGNIAAIVLATAAFFVRRIEHVALSVAVMTYCLPLIAIGPLLQITLTGDAPEVTLAALGVFFTTMVGVLSGLRSASATSIDVVRSLGGQWFAELRYVRMHAALGALLASLVLAAPASVLGALLGEFLGGEGGLGVGLVNAQKIGDAPRAWAYSLTAAALAGAFTLVITGAARILAPWQRPGGAS